MQQERLVHRKIRNTLVHEPLRALRHRITALIEKALVARTTPNFVRIVYNKLEAFIQRIIASRQQPLEEITNEDTPPSDGTGLIDDAWSIAEELLKLDDEEKMWRVIEGVWVEMLCFSAARCRGYLHAKSLGTGGSS
ncbi:Os07g0269500 [Oryza sativa Japonica Group]|nr:Os07g0269500 [Oryza sativa Japonica Group]